ncbi:MAG: 16S rRNA (uracil(1498)-N(3))-methyltransferase [Pseudomonadaceae bacterium]|nr:16S rRNA (uracil(1498)-N(3))-methyltransferase [Pseudomonadaceae bacterium]
MTHNFRQFYCEAPLCEGQAVTLPPALQHRLHNVLRLKAGDTLHLFDGHNGIFAATLADAKARSATVGACVRPFAPPPPLTLLMGLPKRDAWETILRQATELGATEIIPLLARRSVPTKLNMERARALLVEAAEQCERHTVPTLAEPQPLPAGIQQWHIANPASQLAWANENGGAPLHGASAVLVGPEGGFDDNEQQWLSAQPYIHTVTLGPTVLRADTAAACALTLARL